MKKCQAVFWVKNTKCKRVSSDQEWNHIVSSCFNQADMGSYPFKQCYVSFSC